MQEVIATHRGYRLSRSNHGRGAGVWIFGPDGVKLGQQPSVEAAKSWLDRKIENGPLRDATHG